MSRADFWKTTITLPDELAEFLEEMSLNCKKLGGFKIARTEIIRAMIRSLMKLDKQGMLDLSQVYNEEQLEEGIIKAMKKLK